MLKIILFLLIGVASIQVHAQYWFGPKGGIQRTDFIYQDADYKRDSFDVSSDYSGQYGIVLIYQASEKYAVHGEIFYERINKTVTNKEDDEIPIYSKTNFSYLSVPFSLRWNFGKGRTRFYAAGGPKLSFWLGGSGEILLDEFNEARPTDSPVPYDFAFKQSNGGDFDRRAIVEANRIQYGLQLSTGMYIDIVEGNRLLVDLRYSFGHSNMGFNDNPDFNEFDSYVENFEFRNYTLSLSLAYLFEYDVMKQRKGSSTNKLSRKRR